MHNNEPTATLLQVLRDLSRTIEQMAPQQALTAIERDLLLAEMQQLYAQLLHWPVEVARPVATAAVSREPGESVPAPDTIAPPAAEEAPLAPAVQEVKGQASMALVTEEVMEQLAEVVEEAVENALESGKEVALDIQLQVGEPEEASASASELVMEESGPAEAAPTAEAEGQEMRSAAAPVAETTLPEGRSVAFSLSGILQNQGDSHLVMAHLKLKPIDDLKSGIGLNEKFLFIRELFNNDHLAYAQAIEQLNASQRLEAAEQIIANQLLPVYHWDLETEAVVSFLHLVFRRFAPKD